MTAAALAASSSSSSSLCSNGTIGGMSPGVRRKDICEGGFICIGNAGGFIGIDTATEDVGGGELK